MSSLPDWIWIALAVLLVALQPRLAWALVRMVFGLLAALVLAVFAGACL